MKYIMLSSDRTPFLPIIFPDFISHKTIADNFPGLTPMSAGFYEPIKGVYGRSESLNLGHRYVDAIVIKSYYNKEE